MLQKVKLYFGGSQPVIQIANRAQQIKGANDKKMGTLKTSFQHLL